MLTPDMAVIVSLDEHALMQHFRQEREAFFEGFNEAAAGNAEHNAALSDEQVMAIIERARQDVADQAA